MSSNKHSNSFPFRVFVVRNSKSSKVLGSYPNQLHCLHYYHLVPHKDVEQHPKMFCHHSRFFHITHLKSPQSRHPNKYNVAYRTLWSRTPHSYNCRAPRKLWHKQSSRSLRNRPSLPHTHPKPGCIFGKSRFYPQHNDS